MSVDNLPKTIWWEDEKVHMVDQTRLPLQGDVLVCNTYEGLIIAIKTLAVRGAPALGVSGALGIALWAVTEGRELEDRAVYNERLAVVSKEIAEARPTAVNLSWGVKRIMSLIEAYPDATPRELEEKIINEAVAMCDEDEAANRALGAYGAELFDGPTRFLTHCNAGSLATYFYGTALGVIFAAHEQDKVEHVWVDETRPVNQGGRLTAWELVAAGVPSALICDNMAASVMKNGWVDAVVVGADRIAANGDTANKIGTMGLAILAKEFGIPFYIAAPSSTFDLSLATGKEIEIEERDPREIEGVTLSGSFDPKSPEISRGLDIITTHGPADLEMSKGHYMQISRKGAGYSFDAWFKTTPTNVEVYNPAFDVTDAGYITAFITEKGIIKPSENGYTEEIKKILT